MGVAVAAWRSFDDVFALSGITKSSADSLYGAMNVARPGM